jgi:hypothetical protein
MEATRCLQRIARSVGTLAPQAAKAANEDRAIGSDNGGRGPSRCALNCAALERQLLRYPVHPMFRVGGDRQGSG